MYPVNQSPQQQFNHAALMANVVGQVGCLIVFLIAFAFGIGMLLDKLLGTNSIFTVLFLVGSVPVSLYITVRLSLTAVARAQQKLSETNKTEEESEA